MAVDPSQQIPNPVETIEGATVRQAEEGCGMLYGLARALEEVGADPALIEDARGAAGAMRQLTQLHSGADRGGENSHLVDYDQYRRIHEWLRGKNQWS